MRLFFDTSAFVKRYVDESGSDVVESLCDAANAVAVSVLLPIESIATFSRLLRERAIGQADYLRLKTELLTDLRDVTVLSLTPAVVDHTVRSIEASPLEAIDATHLGCALVFKPDLFVSSDKQQLAAAVKMGLTVRAVV